MFLPQVGSLKFFCPEKPFLLGKGCEGTTVYVGILKNGTEVAVKRMLKQASEYFAENEKEILSLTHTEKSPFILSYLDFFKDDHFIYLIVDLCEEALDKHVQSETITVEHLSEHGPRMIQQILKGLDFLHRNGILHLDLKPSNVLVDNEGQIKLADFGMSRVLNEEETTVYTDVRGTGGWMSAEVIEAMNAKTLGRFKRKSDIQVAGMIAFFILTKGQHPFGRYTHDRMTNILEGNPVYLVKLEDPEAKQFISMLIRHNVDDRPYAYEALEHPFFSQVKDNQELRKPDILLLDGDSI